MTRFRALLFGKPLAPWQATAELAVQSALEADEGHRDPTTGIVFQSPGVTVESDDGEPPVMTPDMERWAAALSIIAQQHAEARAYVEYEIQRVAHDPEARARWRLIGKRVAAIMDAAAKDAGS